jgi:hypothetical protein
MLAINVLNASIIASVYGEASAQHPGDDGFHGYPAVRECHAVPPAGRRRDQECTGARDGSGRRSHSGLIP